MKGSTRMVSLHNCNRRGLNASKAAKIAPIFAGPSPQIKQRAGLLSCELGAWGIFENTIPPFLSVENAQKRRGK